MLVIQAVAALIKQAPALVEMATSARAALILRKLMRLPVLGPGLCSFLASATAPGRL